MDFLSAFHTEAVHHARRGIRWVFLLSGLLAATLPSVSPAQTTSSAIIIEPSSPGRRTTAPAALKPSAPDPVTTPVAAPPPADPPTTATADQATTATETAEDATTAPAEGGAASVEELAAALKKAEESSAEEPAKSDVVNLYKEALGAAKAAEEWRTKARDQQALREGAPARMKALQEQIAKLEATELPDVATTATAGDLEPRAAAAEAELSALKKRLEEARTRLDSRTARRTELPRLLNETRQRLEEQRQAANAAPPPGESADASNARQALITARTASLEAEVAALEAEAARLESNADLQALEVEAANKTLARSEARAKQLRDAVNERRRSEAADAVAAARKAREELANSHPAVRTVAAENEELARRRTGPEGLGAKIEQVQKQVAEVDAQREQLKNQSDTLRKRLEATGRTDAIAQLLRKQRRTLPDPQVLKSAISARQKTITEARTQLVEAEDRRANISDEETSVRQALKTDGNLTADEIDTAVRELFTTQRRLLDSTIADLNTWFSTLLDLDTNQRLLQRDATEYIAHIEELVLWTRSTRPVGTADVAPAVSALQWLFSPTNWLELGKGLAGDARNNLALYLPLLFLVPALVGFRRRLKKRLRTNGEQVLDGGDESLLHALKALGLSLSIAALLPALMLLFAWRAQEISDQPDTFIFHFGRALQISSISFFWLLLTRRLCCPYGVAEAHLRWGKRAVRGLFVNLTWFIPVMVASIFVMVMLSRPDDTTMRDSLGRLVFIAAVLAFAWFLHKLLRPDEGVLAPVMETRGGKWGKRLQTVMWVVAPGVALATAIATALGWFYAGIRIAASLQQTFLLAVAVAVAYSLLRRGWMIARRELALKEARRKAAAAVAAAAEKPDAAEGIVLPEATDQADDGASVYEISARVEQLLRVAFAALVIGGLWFIWSDVLPAFNVLNRVELWNYSAQTTEMQTLADGTLKAQSVTKTVPVTPATLVWVTLIIGLTLLVARNITALVEFAFADRLALDAGARFAYTALARYTVLIAGLAFGFRNLGINWGSIQWLAAAVSVGLGFGLQEIFGNFVSGLILLFERPVRVGDTITINGTTGTVTQIRIRATTILDWDGKVLVVPNKSLITSEVSNWTLNDTATRVTVLVGVEYGADVDLVRKILVDVASSHPLVKRPPEPFALFHTFADSTLNFSLFAFTSKLADRGNVIHELHRDVAVRLREAGVSISFPQRDVHLNATGPLEVIMRKANDKPAEGESVK